MSMDTSFDISLSNKEYAMCKFVEAGYVITPLKGKIPTGLDWNKAEYTKDFSFNNFPENYGIVLQDDDLVIDIDPRNFKDSINSFQVFKDRAGYKLEPNAHFTVKTGGGGFHIFHKKPKDLKISENLPGFPGIEFKTKGRQVVGAFSIHPDTGKEYAPHKCSLNGGIRIRPAPERLLNFIIAKETILNTEKSSLLEFSDDKQSKDRFIKYLSIKEGAVQGDLGDKATFQISCRGRDFGLSPEITLELLLEHWNDKCQPPWEFSELMKKVKNAYSYNVDIVGKNHPKTDFDIIPARSREELINMKWELNRDGSYKKTLVNLLHIFKADKSLFEMLRLNEFTDDIEFVHAAPWHSGQSFRIWTDEDAVDCKFYIALHMKFEVPINMIHEAAGIVSRYNKYHPVKEYLENLTWDGQDRLNIWLHKYLGVENTPYTRTISKKTLVAAVSRIYSAGCKFDHVLVLEGRQDLGKSLACEVLGKGWYSDPSINIQDKDSVTQLKGKWIVELPEMECATRAETRALKAFITRKVDRIRPAYARNTRDFPRQSIFIGTINPEHNGYLKDTTGNRRYWPVTCGALDISALKRDIDQIWAQALCVFQQGEVLYLENPEIRAEAYRQAEMRRSRDPWVDIIEPWLASTDSVGNARDFVKGKDIWEECIGGAARFYGRKEQVRIADVMTTDLGWRKSVRTEIGGSRSNGYVRQCI